MPESIAFLSAAQLRRRMTRGDLAAVEVVEACLAQIKKYNPALNAVVTLNERALDEARKLDRQRARGKPLGLLHGLPVGIKDVTPVAGLRTTFGSPLFADYVPKEDALVVQRLKAAGAIILGKTNCPEFAAGGNTFNEVFGRTRNPWNPKLSAGGSTGGGAAGLATGMIALAEGTDLGGSLRIPASFCGLVGLRPSPGLAPTYPADYLWDQFQVTGGVARTAEDAALMLQAIAGPSPLCPIREPVTGRNFVKAAKAGIPKRTRIAYCQDIAGIGVEEDIERACRQAAFEMKHAGAKVEEIALDLSFVRKPFLAFRGYWFLAQLHRHLDKIDRLGVNVSNNLKAGLQVTTEELAAAEAARTKLWHIFYEFFQKFDYLLTPCMAIPPFAVEQNYPETIAGKKMETYVDWIAPTFVLSLTSLPVASVPCGFDGRGLPVGLQIVGKPMGEEAVLALTKLVQDARGIGLPELENIL